MALVIALVRAAEVLGRDPYQQIKQHEDLVGRFPSNMSFPQKLFMINLFGISPTNPGRILGLSVAVIALLFLMLWLQ